MKNRGYAAQCRIKREDKCKELKEELQQLDQNHNQSRVYEDLAVEFEKLDRNIETMKDYLQQNNSSSRRS